MLNIISKTSKILRSSNYEVVKWTQDLHDRWVSADQNNRDRMFAALRAYFDIDGGAWDIDDITELKRQNRHPTSINIAAQKINTLAGSILSEQLDFDYMTQDIVKSHLIDNVKNLYYYDKEHNDYKYSARKTCIRGLIHLGIEEIGIDYSIRPTGSITFEPRLPGYIHKDPYWRSDRLKDWKRAMKDAWMTAEEILEHFQINDPMLEQRAKIDCLGGEDYQPIENVDDFKDIPETHGSKLLVIEYRWLERLKTTRLYMNLPGGKVIPLPLNVKENEVRRFMKMFNIDSAENINEYPYEDQILKYSVICPNGTTSPIVENKQHPIQCGYIGFFPFSSCKEMGIDKGVMESYLDIQRTLNYRESKKDDIIASGGSGATVVDTNKLVRKKEQLEEIKQNKTRPDYVCEVDGDPDSAFGKFPTGDVPGDIWNDLARLIDLLDRVGPVSPALEGAQSKDESGVLFQMRHTVSKLGTIIFYDNWLQHEEDKAEAWYNQAQITYKGIYMKVPDASRPGFVEMNTPLGNGMYGNSIDMLPRAKIIVTLSKTSPTEQMAKRALYYDMTKMLAANPEASLPQYRRVVNKMIETIELDPKEKQNFKMISDIQEQNDILKLLMERETMVMQMKQGQLGSAQADMALQQLNSQLNEMLAGAQEQQQEQGGGNVYTEENEMMPQLPPMEEGVGGAEERAEEMVSSQAGQPVETIRGSFQP